MLIQLDESHRQLVHQVRDEAGEWLATKGTDQYRGGLDMAKVHANIDHDFDKYPFVGWEVDGRVVAMMALIDPEPDFWTPEELAEPQTYISRFFVVEHGKDYGSALLEAVIAQARQEGKQWVRLNCWTTNTRLHDYYRAHGFELVRTCNIPGRMSGALFQRDLSDMTLANSSTGDALTSSVIHDLMALTEGMESLTFDRRYLTSSQIAYGWYMRVRRTGEALLLLDKDGFGDEASPLRRTILEHAIALTWLVDAREESVNALKRKHQERTRKLSGKLSEGWKVTAEDLAHVLDEEIDPSPQETYLAFAHQCGKYGSPEVMVAWLLETAASHPSLRTADAYIGEDGDENVLRGSSKYASDAKSTGALAMFLLVATSAFNEFLQGQPWTEELDQINERLNAPAAQERE